MSYAGGKGGAGVVQAIINQLPPHRVYVEAFAGGGAVLRAKLPATSTIAVERDVPACAALESDLPEVTVINDDAISWLSKFAPSGDELIYCDPPYLKSTRRSQRDIYAHELSEADHRRLLSVLKTLRCSIAISGYYSQLYARELRDWRTITFTTTTRGGKRAEEWLWMNYPEPIALHDYRYLGSNFRERERIKRKKLRWKNRLAKMSILERRAMLLAISESGDPATSFSTVIAGADRRDRRCDQARAPHAGNGEGGHRNRSASVDDFLSSSAGTGDGRGLA